MLAITVEFLHGTFRGASADDLALMGSGEDSGEWPPSPARLFSAFVAADGTGSRMHVTDGSGLLALEAADPPTIYADRPAGVAVTQLQDRYVVVDEFHQEQKSRETGAVQEYVGRTATLVRPGSRRAPATASVVYLWPQLDLDAGQFRDLQLRAARVPYLGCADSPVRVRVKEEIPEGLSESNAWQPDGLGGVTLPVPGPGFLGVLDNGFERWSAGEPVRRAWLPTPAARYREPGARPPKPAQPQVVWVRFDRAVSGRKVVAVTEALRAAVLRGYQDLIVGSREEVPAVLHAHGFEGSGGQHVHWLALPHVGVPHATGQIYGAAVWLPPDVEPAIADGVRRVLWHLSGQTLAHAGVFEVRLRLAGDERFPVAADPKRWQARARVWVSAFPVVHERWQAGGPDLDEVARWCRHAGIAVPPVGFTSSPVPLVAGAVALRPHEVQRAGRERRPYSHIKIEFAEPVPGPVILGRGRQFGLGLMAQAPAPRAKREAPNG